eukprot:TRINITY_DN29832_c0_g1_i1.p1 TRINITY_DN29832_c0_g1~~TRINITY_DN29832_c0_g1_i1.p1  ORF type:complete len:773 (+),score=106.68 TRINITY_DN29832_c0_g1_i1:24-2321(+)
MVAGTAFFREKLDKHLADLRAAIEEAHVASTAEVQAELAALKNCSTTTRGSIESAGRYQKLETIGAAFSPLNIVPTHPHESQAKCIDLDENIEVESAERKSSSDSSQSALHRPQPKRPEGRGRVFISEDQASVSGGSGKGSRHGSPEAEDSDSSSGSEKSSETHQVYPLAPDWHTVIQRSSIGTNRSTRTSQRLRTTIFRQAGNQRNSSVSSLMGRNQQGKALSRWHMAMFFMESTLMMEPYSRKHVAWEVSCSLFLLYDIFVLPVSIAFDVQPTPITDLMVWIMRIFWTIDIAVNFITGYVDGQGATIMAFHKVARHYLRGNLALDTVVVLFDWLDAVFGVRATGFIKSWRLIRIVRLLRLRKAYKLFDRLSEYVAFEQIMVLVRVNKNLAILLVLFHFLACAEWGVGELGIPDKTSWTLSLQNLPLEEKYSHAFHMSISHFYGEHLILPQSQVERVFTILVLYLSFIWQIWFVSSITTAMTHLEIVSSHRSNMFASLDRFLTAYSLPRELRVKIHRNARHALHAKEHNTQESSIELLRLISEPLLMRLHYQMYMSSLAVAPWCRCLQELHEPAMVRLCHDAMCVEEAHQDDIVFAESDKPMNALVRFISMGSACYRSAQSVIKIGRQHWISEMVLWTDEWLHRGSLHAESDIQILGLSAEKFRNIIATQSDIRSAIIFYAELVVNQEDVEILSDVMEYQTEMDSSLCMAFPNVWDYVKPEFKELEDNLSEDGQAGLAKRWSKRFSARASVARTSVRLTARRPS